MPAFRRRLIDVGDMTIDEPEIHDLLAEQEHLEEEIIHNISRDDDNETLTFRDMAKAATPKWSNRRTPSNTTVVTPLSSPTLPPRTPLAEIFIADDKTPMGPKLKSYRRPIVSTTFQSPSIDNGETPVQQPSSPSVKLSTDSEGSSLSFISPPRIQIQLESQTQEASSSKEASRFSVCTLDLPTTEASIADTPIPSAALGSSVCTLDLPSSTGTLITDTPMPVLNSSASSRMSLDVPVTHARLKPSNDSANRLSVDLQSSFQLHLNSSDTTFDLLNEKMSFFNSKDGMDSFLDNVDIDDSFEGNDFGEIKQLKDLPAKEVISHKGTDSVKDLQKDSPAITGTSPPITHLGICVDISDRPRWGRPPHFNHESSRRVSIHPGSFNVAYILPISL